MKSLLYLVAGTLVFGAGMGCSTTPPNVVAIDRSANLPAEVAKTRQEYTQEAVQQQIQALSPEYSRRAERSLKKAEEDLRENKTDKAYTNLEEARAWLQQARAVSRVSRVEFAQALKAREAALEIKGDPNEVTKVDRDLANLAERIEDGKSVSDSDKQDIINKYTDAQRKRLKTSYLDPVEDRLSVAKDNGARRLAPRTYNKARQDFEAAETVLEIAPLRREEFLLRAQAADRSSLETLAVLRQTAANNSKTTEEMVLASIQAQRAANSSYQAAVDERNRLSAQVTGLQQKAQPQELLEKLQAQLPADKAEILMSPEGEVMIRLKELQFRTNSADLAPQAAVILTDVKSALADVNPKRLKVEGHTDATGTTSTNQNLSKERADTVAQFLKNDKVLSVTEIETVGFGASKPLGNNKTKNGRAENRRVEILIESL